MAGIFTTPIHSRPHVLQFVLISLLSSLGTVVSPPMAAAQQFYPLQSGNKWSYRVFHIDYVHPADSSAREPTVIGDTMMANGKVYHQLNQPDAVGARFIREDSNYVYYYSPYDTVEAPMYNLKAEPGTSDTIRWGPLGRSTVTSSSEQTILGKVTTVREYSMDGLVQYRVTLARGLGIVGAWDMGDAFRADFFQWNLRGANIDDTLYGILVGVKETEARPVGFSLYQNYPNPFNPTTTIEYALPRRSHVTIALYNTLGQHIATLVNSDIDAGYHSVPFDASGLSSGVYFYRLQAESFVDTKKLLLVR